MKTTRNSIQVNLVISLRSFMYLFGLDFHEPSWLFMKTLSHPGVCYLKLGLVIILVVASLIYRS